jgi:predicted DCC family thiol-disulfide oxidoreductase YuxK
MNIARENNASYSTQRLVLYDGDCGICQRAVSWLRKVDSKMLFRFEPFQNVAEVALGRLGTNSYRCSMALHAQRRDGVMSLGHSAFHTILREYEPWDRIVYAFEATFALEEIERFAYYCFARSRHNVSKMVGLTKCQLR